MARALHNTTLKPTTPSTPRKVYVDGAYNEEYGRGAVGIVIADHNEAPVVVHNELCGHVDTSVKAEVEALERALDTLANSAANHVQMYTDCEPALEKIKWSAHRQFFHTLKAKWVSRADNMVAHKLAALSMTNYPDNQ